MFGTLRQKLIPWLYIENRKPLYVWSNLLCKRKEKSAGHIVNNTYIFLNIVVRDSSVGIVTRYGLDGPVEESFSAPVQTGLGAHPVSYTMGTGSFLRVQRPGSDVDH